MASRLGSRVTWVVAAGVLVAVCVVGWLVWATDRDFTSEEVDVAAEQVVGGPEDCWGGALDGEPMVCYVMEHAQADGALEVVGVFLAPSGPIYVVLEQEEPIDDALLKSMQAKYKEFMITPQGAMLYGLNGRCKDFGSLVECVDDWVGDGPWRFNTPDDFSMFSRFTSTHDDVLVLHGGLPARKRVPGWASWEQLWPEVPASERDAVSQSDQEGSFWTSPGFDVSDVDMITGLGDEDCEGHDWAVSDGKCVTWRTYGHLGLVGVRSTSDYFPGMTPTLYVQIKSPPPDPQEIERIKLELLDDYDKARFKAGELNIEIIPVEYDLGELWRWAVILDRFKYSKSNTVGLTAAWVGTNGVAINEPADIRITINVAGLDPLVVAAALPELLPALGIPVDAVGRVEHEETDQRRYLLHQPDASQSGTPEPAEIIIPLDQVSVATESNYDDITEVVDSAGFLASDGHSGDANTPPAAGGSQSDQQTATGASSNGGGVASGGSHADPQGMAASRGSGGSVEGSEAQSLAASSEVAESGSSGSAADDGGVSVWWLVGLAALAAVAAIGVGVLWSRRA